MRQLNDLSRSFAAFNPETMLIAAIEMSQSSWLVAGIVPGRERHPLKKLTVDEGRCCGSCGHARARDPVTQLARSTGGGARCRSDRGTRRERFEAPGEGLTKAGNARVRRGMIQLARRFLMFQKQSALAQWYRSRTADACHGTRQSLIVAMARKLLIGLWRFVTTGETLVRVAMRPA